MDSGVPQLHHSNPHPPGMTNQGTGLVSSNPLQSLPPPSTLLIRHLPEAIPLDTLSRLFTYYGASSVRPLSGGRVRNCAFVDFRDEAAAMQAHHQLNGLQFLGKVLSVEKASKSSHDNKHLGNETEKGNRSATSGDITKGRDSQEANKSERVFAGEPIAEKLGVNYPFPPHLEYSYPPPDGNILTNIVNALIAVPRFYTQVLHLMNKMNIPAPFRMALPTPPLPVAAPDAVRLPSPPPLIVENPILPNMSSDESEMETSDKEVDDAAQARRKRIKRETIVGPAVDKDVAHETVGLKPATLVPKEIPVIKKKIPVLQIKIAPKQIQENKDVKVAEKPDKAEVVVDDKAFVTAEEIEKQKLPPEEILSLPMFKNYSAGNPACVLYIKNLAKDVAVDDFYIIFGSLFGSISAAKSGLTIRLMQEGRMRGQAFVTFPSVEIARHALNLVNGYVFKGKPMIIQFGRNPAAASSKAS